MNAFDTLTLEATLLALAEQPNELPASLQQSLGTIGQEFATHQPQAVDQLRALVSESSLNVAYAAAYRDLQTHSSQVERNKSLLLSANGSLTIDLDILAAGILTAPQPPQAARQFLQSLQRSAQGQKLTTRLWERLDRIMIMAAGGAFLGGTIGQIPGAVIGTLLAALYGGYLGIAKPTVQGHDR